MATPNPGVTSLLRPIQLILLSALYLPVTVFHLCSTYQLSKFASWSAFQHAWFGKFWAYYGPLSAKNSSTVVGPLLRNASGVVLDIGPGNGEWVNLLGPAKNNDISHIYGVEPNYEHHAALRRRVVEAGLENVYEILGVGAEGLSQCGIQPRSIDTICTIQCLCSTPNPERIIRDLFPYLKPGGKWLFFEHVRTKYQSNFVGCWQRWIDCIWPIFFDGCSITCTTDRLIVSAGEWKSVSLKPADVDSVYDAIPHVIGTLVKK